MIIDLHAHSVKSDDGRAKVENYCKWINTKQLPLDGFVLTEHRQFDFESDYSPLGEQYNILILKGAEVETEYGHVLVFGVSQPLYEEFDFASINLPLEEVIKACERHNAVAVPCHPGRPRVGMAAHLEEFGIPNGVKIVEIFNGGSRNDEDDIAHSLAAEQGYAGIGGSDAHIVSHIGRCATRFSDSIREIDDLVAALQNNAFEAITFR